MLHLKQHITMIIDPIVPEDWGSMILRNINGYKQNNTTSRPQRQKYSSWLNCYLTYSVLKYKNEKRKVVPVLKCHEDVKENGGIAPPSMASVLGGGERSAPRSGRAPAAH
jgi:hypothetical protein